MAEMPSINFKKRITIMKTKDKKDMINKLKN